MQNYLKKAAKLQENKWMWEQQSFCSYQALMRPARHIWVVSFFETNTSFQNPVTDDADELKIFPNCKTETEV